MSYEKIHFIINPASGGGSTGKTWAQMRSYIESKLGTFSFEFTANKGHGIDLAKRAAEKSVEKIVAIGGDGSISEIVSGILLSGNTNVVIGVLNLGTGGDFCRTLGIPGDIKLGLEKIKSGSVISSDIGKVSFTDNSGSLAMRSFINIAGCGMSGEVVRTINQSKKIFGGFSYYVSSLKNLFTYQNKRVRILADEMPEKMFTSVTVAVCNGQYFGGGMRVAPNAQISDGMFDVVIMEDWNLWEKLKYSPRLYNSTILSCPKITHFRAKKIVILPQEGENEVYIDCDGEDVGTIPMTLEILPSAVRFTV